MDQSPQNHAELQLPPPVPEYVPTGSLAPEQAVAMPELQPVQPTAAAPQAPAMPLPMASSAPIFSTQNPQASLQDDASSTTKSVVPSVADDGDLIEKEWVAKAKQIVDSTRDDPFEQSKKLTVFKSDYLQKRYNKTIKLSE